MCVCVCVFLCGYCCNHTPLCVLLSVPRLSRFLEGEGEGLSVCPAGEGHGHVLIKVIVQCPRCSQGAEVPTERLVDKRVASCRNLVQHILSGRSYVKLNE